MAADGSEIDYAGRIEQALRGALRELLAEVAERGLPGENHFYLTFRTDSPGVVLSAALRERYPEEMTVVLQHQFWDLEVDDDCFSVTLKFSGTPQRIAVPFAALTAFADPCAEFGLRFQQLEADLAQGGSEDPDTEDGASEGDPSSVPERNGKVVQIDDFRRS
ncbi:MAG TPA: ClpXP protease specificity-enhancing factor SspB [Thermoanaerobaculia bacterium]|nr:ClpXP protease specificity-enhancing factor SspB [Thermoanaerobaculia bacterium]